MAAATAVISSPSSLLIANAPQSTSFVLLSLPNKEFKRLQKRGKYGKMRNKITY